MNKPFFVAEVSGNHLGSLDRAIKLIDAAAEAGAGGVKFQCWSSKHMVLDTEYVIQDGPWAGKNLAKLYEEAKTPWTWFRQLFDHAKFRGLVAFSSVFDLMSLQFLETLDCPIYKISSFELTDLPLIRAAAKTGKPLIISTGMATMDEIEYAKFAALQGGCKDLTLLACTSAYPAAIQDANVSRMWGLRATFDEKVGLSDHTLGSAAAIAACFHGASVIEKHLTLARADGGPDAGFSSEPAEFKAMVTACTEVLAAVGDQMAIGNIASEAPQRALRRSLYFNKSIEAGQTITEDDVVCARPALGMAPADLANVIGQRPARAVHRGTPVTKDLFPRLEKN